MMLVKDINKMRVEFWDGGYPGTIKQWNDLHDQAILATVLQQEVDDLNLQLDNIWISEDY